ncbi:MAG: ABC transporter permease [Sulfurospirillum sp.]|nr:ABC transporter permease [Sulfurospirillum sp.]
MVELIFVIVVLGILAAVAIPRLAASRDDAVLVKGKSQISAIRSGIALQKAKRMMEGTVPFIPASLDNAALDTDNERLFNFTDGNASNILEYPILSKLNSDGYWFKDTNTTYKFQLTTSNIATFTYSSLNGTFNCSISPDCNTLTQ